MNLTNQEIAFMAKIMSVYANNKNFTKRAGGTSDPKDIVNNFDYDRTFGYIMKDKYVYGERNNHIIKALEKSNESIKNPIKALGVVGIDIAKLNQDMENDTNLIQKAREYSVISEVNEVFIQSINSEVLKRLKPYFKTFEYYGFEVLKMTIVGIDGLQQLKVHFSSAENNLTFFNYFPAVNKNGSFMAGDGSMYVAQFQPKNFEEYMTNPARTIDDIKAGKSPLILRHIYEYLCEEMVTYRSVNNGVSRMTKGAFLKSAVYANRKCFQALQKRMHKIIFATKEFGESQNDTPIVWCNKHLSKYAIDSLCSCVALMMDYDMLTKYPKVPGLDLLTGSTSEPGRRIKLAHNFKIERYEYNNSKGEFISELILLEKPKSEQVGEYGDYASSFKCRSPFFTKCGLKRNNDSTSKDSYELVAQCGYQRKVKTRIGIE